MSSIEGGFALVVAKGGPKLKQATDDEAERLTRRTVAAPITQMTGQHMSMAALAVQITSMSMPAGRGPVVDKTNLAGFFDFQATWQPEGIVGTSTVERVGPTLSSAMEEQLGLRLEGEKNVPVELFVFDHVERPTLD